jgi:hypothetical protein
LVASLDRKRILEGGKRRWNNNVTMEVNENAEQGQVASSSERSNEPRDKIT